MSDHQFDRIDQRILRELQQDARLSTAQLAERIALTPSPIWRRIKALETAGVIRGYHADINPKKNRLRRDCLREYFAGKPID